MQASTDLALTAALCDVKETHDHCLVRTAFLAMTLEARDFLWERLNLESKYEAAELPEAHSFTGEDFLWHELLAAAHQTGGRFFVVMEMVGGEAEPTFVSADVVTSQAWARKRMAEAGTSRTEVAVAVQTQRNRSTPFKKPPASIVVARD